MPMLVGTVDEYVSVCCRCGCALKEEEIMANITGPFQDYKKGKVYRYSSLDFCEDCSRATRKYATDSVQVAVFRMQQLEHP